MKYLCEICGKTFDTSIVCKKHIEEHKVEDLYGKWFVISDTEIYKPGGYVILADGYLMSGVSVTISEERINFSKSHFPPEVLREKPIADNEIILESINKSILHILSDCVEEMCMNLINRQHGKNPEEDEK